MRRGPTAAAPALLCRMCVDQRAALCVATRLSTHGGPKSGKAAMPSAAGKASDSPHRLCMHTHTDASSTARGSRLPSITLFVLLTDGAAARAAQRAARPQRASLPRRAISGAAAPLRFARRRGPARALPGACWHHWQAWGLPRGSRRRDKSNPQSPNQSNRNSAMQVPPAGAGQGAAQSNYGIIEATKPPSGRSEEAVPGVLLARSPHKHQPNQRSQVLKH
eukprot:COSAG02_NODE_186_length_30414_cov_24.815372_3_plen_221_part_00